MEGRANRTIGPESDQGNEAFRMAYEIVDWSSSYFGKTLTFCENTLHQLEDLRSLIRVYILAADGLPHAAKFHKSQTKSAICECHDSTEAQFCKRV